MSRIEVEDPREAYRKFLAGYWFTAPLAWIYAIPVEAMVDEISALRFCFTAQFRCCSRGWLHSFLRVAISQTTMTNKLRRDARRVDFG